MYNWDITKIEKMYNWDITKTDLDAMRLDAIKAALLADGTRMAYHEAVRSFWYKKVRNAIGGVFNGERPREATALFQYSGRIPVLVFDVIVDYFGGPIVCYYMKNKDGKWGKSIRRSSAELFSDNAKPVDS